MKKQSKKLTSLLLAVMMVVGLMAAMPLTASAADEEIISSVSVSITAPIAGENPDFSPISGDPDKYTVSVNYWYVYIPGIGNDDATYLTASDTFVAGTEYAVRVYFDAYEGYLFDTLDNGLSVIISRQEIR